MLCDHLEDYICRLLPSETEGQFEQHLEHCSACRDAVARERAMFSVVAEAVETLERAPSTLVVQKPTVPPVRRRQGSGAVVVCMIALAVFAFVLLLPRQPATKLRNTPIAHSVRSVPPPRIELPDDVPGVVIASGDPNIHIVLINAPVRGEVDFLTPDSDDQLVAVQ